jgi:hypothetical protein
VTVYQNRADYPAPPCPNCGAKADVRWNALEVNDLFAGWVVTGLECSARCFEQTPDEYLTAVNTHWVVS